MRSSNCFLHVGTNDAGKIWVDEILVIDNPLDGVAECSEHFVQLNLAAGSTPVLMKIDQAGGNWGAYVELYGIDAHKKFVTECKARNQAKDLDHPESIASHIKTQVICKQEDRYIGD